MHKKKKSKKMEHLISDINQRLEGIQNIPSVFTDRALKIGARLFLRCSSVPIWEGRWIPPVLFSGRWQSASLVFSMLSICFGAGKRKHMRL